MSVHTAIGLVSASVRRLLLKTVDVDPVPAVTVLAPDEPGDTPRLNLFLYRVAEHPFLRNQEPMPSPKDPRTVLAPPLSLTLTYLLTPYAPNDPITGNSAAQALLGAAMRAFYEHPVIADEFLEPELVGAREPLRIVPDHVDPEALGRLWTTFTQPFRLSVAYQVSPVQLDVRTAPRPIPGRVRRTGVPEVLPSAAPPVVDGMSPVSGPAGTRLGFTGTHLADRRAEVRFGGRPVVDGLALAVDAFEVEVPATASPGLYEVRVAVSGDFVRTFLYEVTP